MGQNGQVQFGSADACGFFVVGEACMAMPESKVYADLFGFLPDPVFASVY
jgi:hypothetical protein